MSLVPPPWLSEFVDEVSQSLEPIDVMAPLGCHFHVTPDELWEVTLFAARTEVVGGVSDGKFRLSRFRVHLLPLLELFDSLDEVYWQAQGLGAEDDLGPHVALVGQVGEHQVWLRIPSAAPHRFEPGRRALVNQGRLEEVW